MLLSRFSECLLIDVQTVAHEKQIGFVATYRLTQEKVEVKGPECTSKKKAEQEAAEVFLEKLKALGLLK